MTRNSQSSFRTAFWPLRLFAAAFSLFAIVVLMCGTAGAQLSGKGTITGKVADSTGAAIPNAIIVASNDATGVSVSTTSTSAGDYNISTLDAGIYTVTITANGFEKLSQKDVHVNALESQTYNPQLTVGATSETVTVSSAPPQLETTNATLGATMEQEMYSALPIEMGAYGNPDQRRATDFAFLMPGVQGNNTNGNPTTNTGIVNGSGSRGAVSVVYIDGTPFVRAGGNGDPRYVWTAVSVDAVDQFQVQTSGYSAIYEGQGIQNYVVKQGGPKYHGTLYEFFRNTALDSWGFFGKLPNAQGKVIKPIEHSNEYGISLSGPVVPFGTWRDKIFAFGNYNGFRYASETPTQLTFPTPNQQAGNFQGVLTNGVVDTSLNGQLTKPTGAGIYDPSTQTACTANNAGKPCRYRYGFGPSGTPNCPQPYTCVDQIPASQFSAEAKLAQSFFPAGIGTALQNNYLSPNRTGLTNWSTTDRIDYIISPRHTLTMIGAIGRQASSNPTGQTTAGRNVGPIPYNYGQTFAPKTAVGIIEETYTITPHLVNQFKYGYARYNGPTFDADQLPAFSATTLGITGAPSGAASQAFPITTFAGTNPSTNWGGTSPNVTLAENYTILDNVQWVKGPHTITIGGQTAWLLYNVVSATGGSTALTLATTGTETEGLNNAFTAIGSTGHSYASFLIGQIDSVSFTSFLQQEFGARFRAISPYVQDNWKVSNRLTLDVGLRYDFFPSVTEVHNAGSFFSPTLTNPVTNQPGALQFTGSGPGTCNCSSPVNNYFKNFGPRLGLAYQLDSKTVLRASYGVMFTHGDAVGGLATSLGTLGFSVAPKSAATGTLLSSSPFTPTTAVVPGFTPASGVSSGPAFGTGFTTTAGFTAAPQSIGYPDPYLGGRAPEYINYTLGFQHQWTNAFTSTISYVGSQGHFLQADGSNARGHFADQLDPQFLRLTTKLADTGANLTADCANAALQITCPAGFTTGQQLNAALKPFPFQSVGDSFGYVANSNYNALQTSFNWRSSYGLTFMANYTWSRTIDDGGTFRTGYAIPAAFSGNGKAWSPDRIERTISTSNQPQHVVVTGVWDVPMGKSFWASSAWERAVLGGYKFSSIFQAFSGSPLAIIGSSCATNQAQSGCPPTLNPNFAGKGRVPGKWGKGYLAGQAGGGPSYIVPSVCDATAATASGPFLNPVAPSGGTSCLHNPAFIADYVFGNAPRTGAYNIYGPGNYTLDIGLVRSFPLHLSETSRFDFRAEWYNVTNHTKFAVAGVTVGNTNFGQVATDPTAPRKSVQLSARIAF